MAKTDHFYIRAAVDNNTVPTFNQTEIDLGSFVDALGKSVLRIHSISVQFTHGTNAGYPLVLAAASEATMAWQLTTQSQTDVVDLANKSVISMGAQAFCNTNAVVSLSGVFDQGDRVDQTWTDGYLVAVEQIYIGILGGASTNWGAGVNPEMSIILDCTVETLSEKAAMALALSQQ